MDIDIASVLHPLRRLEREYGGIRCAERAAADVAPTAQEAPRASTTCGSARPWWPRGTCPRQGRRRRAGHEAREADAAGRQEEAGRRSPAGRRRHAAVLRRLRAPAGPRAVRGRPRGGRRVRRPPRRGAGLRLLRPPEPRRRREHLRDRGTRHHSLPGLRRGPRGERHRDRPALGRPHRARRPHRGRLHAGGRRPVRPVRRLPRRPRRGPGRARRRRRAGGRRDGGRLPDPAQRLLRRARRHVPRRHQEQRAAPGVRRAAQRAHRHHVLLCRDNLRSAARQSRRDVPVYYWPEFFRAVPSAPEECPDG